MSDGAQVIEKNHFLAWQNRRTVLPMNRHESLTPARRRFVLMLIVAALIAAMLAPVAVLAG
jgi:Tfp pilus assembly protein PilN